MIKEITAYYAACEAIVARFAKKQGIEHTGNHRGVYDFISQYYFSIDDIILDLENNAKPGLIMQWQNDTVDYCLKNKRGKNDTRINYQSYIMGLRYEDLKQKSHVKNNRANQN